MAEEHEDLAKVIPFPTAKPSDPAAASTAQEERLARLRADIAATEAEYAPVAAAPGEEPVEVSVESAMDEAAELLVRALARSPKSEREADRLLAEQTDLEPLERERVVHRMIDLGYLDDARLAEQLATGSLSRKGLGRGGMSRERQRRGIPESVAEAVLAEFGGDEEYERALELGADRARKLRGVDREVARRRLYGFLARRGYGGDIVGRVVRELLS